MNGLSGVVSAEEVASHVDGTLIAFDGELSSAEGFLPSDPVFGGGGEAVSVRALFGEAAG